MSSVFGALISIIIGIVFAGAKTMIKTDKDNSKPRYTNNYNRNADVPKSMDAGTKGSAGVKPQGSIVYLSKKMEDRQNDWLARQLAYEKAIKYRMGKGM